MDREANRVTVKRTRRLLGLTQQQLANESDVSRVRVCLFERGRVDLSSAELKRLDTALQRLREQRLQQLQEAS